MLAEIKPKLSSLIPAGNFSKDFERVENLLANPNSYYHKIDDVLNYIERRARNKNDSKALNSVACYRERLRNRIK